MDRVLDTSTDRVRSTKLHRQCSARLSSPVHSSMDRETERGWSVSPCIARTARPGHMLCRDRGWFVLGRISRFGDRIGSQPGRTQPVRIVMSGSVLERKTRQRGPGRGMGFNCFGGLSQSRRVRLQEQAKPSCLLCEEKHLASV
ncbi:hypothetical protein PV04_03741 [Phialophora macrospora]|uniref:Uncharacterized protein n=1 Tax=Phialophora macrospora TaxID=1851006 RepID=A0A0D2EBD5_9EURO|nr:hypothetical protein PV04_03741 [Phialophora macrospora]